MPASLLWDADPSGNKVYLTFDDGPTETLTDEILSILDQFQAKATFFCVGDNVRKYPEIYRSIFDQGHQAGNHTYNHVNGWKTTTDTYLENIRKASEYIDSRLFRPPYGRITGQQAKALSNDYRIIMWTVLSRDYDQNTSPEKSFRITKSGIRPGAIIVFHDNIKAAEKLKAVLPRTLEYLVNSGYCFGRL